MPAKPQVSFLRRLPDHLDAIAVVAIAVFLFVGSLVGLARAVDRLARTRQEVLIRNSLKVFVGEVATRVIGIADWDDAVRNLDNRFDPAWADQNVGKYFQATYGTAPSFVLNGGNRPVYGVKDLRHPEWSNYSLFASSAMPLLSKVRSRERKRGALRAFRTAGEISVPIQEGGMFRTRAGDFVMVATLVQPDFGKALPNGPRAPIMLICQEIDGPLLKAIGKRVGIGDLRIAKTGDRSTTAVALDSAGRVTVPLTWTAFQPGRDVVAVAMLPIMGGILLLLGLYFRGRATAAKLNKIIGELAGARDAAVNANRVKNEFLANMSHELRTPLNAILGFSEMLGFDAFACHRTEYARIIHRSGTQLLSLVNDLLDLSRIEAGKFALHAETFEFDVLIDECMMAFASRCAPKGIRLERVADGPVPLLHADRRALQQILLNLLSNAAKFTKAGKQIRVFVHAHTAEGLDFGVVDEGTGIAEEDQASVFERFGKGRHDLVRNAEGAGLGLPIVKGLAEAHGGSVSLISRLDAGTRVTVHLPARCVVPQQPLGVAA